MQSSQATAATPNEPAMAGDWLKVDSTNAGSPRRGEILEVLGSGAHIHFRVRWDEEHVSLFYPAERGFVVHAKQPPGEREQLRERRGESVA